MSSTATTYDDDGNMTRRVERTFDSEGNVTSATTTVNTLDNQGQVMTAQTTVIVDGVRQSATSESYSQSGALIQRTTETYENGVSDTRVEVNYDEGGAPVTTRTTVYDDEGTGMSVTTQIEDGRESTAYGPGDYERTTRNPDGTVTRETIQVNDNGTLTYREVVLSDETGKAIRSEETYYDSQGEQTNNSVYEYSDGRAVIHTATTSDDDGSYVSVQSLGDDLAPDKEVRTSYDNEGNVTDKTYIEYDDDGNVIYQGDEPRNASLYDQLEVPESDLTVIDNEVDASNAFVPGVTIPDLLSADTDSDSSDDSESSDDDADEIVDLDEIMDINREIAGGVPTGPGFPDPLTGDFLKVVSSEPVDTSTTADFGKIETFDIDPIKDPLAQGEDFGKIAGTAETGDDFLKIGVAPVDEQLNLDALDVSLPDVDGDDAASWPAKWVEPDPTADMSTVDAGSGPIGEPVASGAEFEAPTVDINAPADIPTEIPTIDNALEAPDFQVDVPVVDQSLIDATLDMPIAVPADLPTEVPSVEAPLEDLLDPDIIDGP